jgi:hypothetical protein
MMDLNDLRTVLDFGMVVLLWLVQRVIYPSFLECSEERLVVWHKTYVKRVGPIIMPMMLMQLFCLAWLTYKNPDPANLVALVALIACWVLTFAVSVPLHQKIDAGDTSRKTICSLIHTNWPRTILWTLVFVLGVV